MIDRQFIFALDVLRLSAATRAKLLPILEAMSKELRGTLADTDATAWSKARAAAIIGDAKAIIKAHYAEAQGQLMEATDGVARVSARVAAADLDFLTPPSIAPGLAPAALLDKLAGDSLIQGAVQADWWQRQTADTTFRFASAVRQGIAAGDTNQRIIARVKQTTDIAVKNISALVHTSVQTVANEARQAVFEANRDLLKGYRWITALDGLVCPLCAARADLMWDVDHEPIDHDIPWEKPPIHFNDRCLIVPETKSWKELGIDLPEPAEGTRASMDGQVPASRTFGEFLSRQSKEFQDDTLGKGRAELYRSGKITLQDLVSGNGRPLTLAKLQAKYGG